MFYIPLGLIAGIASIFAGRQITSLILGDPYISTHHFDRVMKDYESDLREKSLLSDSSITNLLNDHYELYYTAESREHYLDTWEVITEKHFSLDSLRANLVSRDFTFLRDLEYEHQEDTLNYILKSYYPIPFVETLMILSNKFDSLRANIDTANWKQFDRSIAPLTHLYINETTKLLKENAERLERSEDQGSVRTPGLPDPDEL